MSSGGGSSREQVRTLEYKQAMSDFCTMFPTLDKNVIECVLRTNNGHVESTIDQLLQLTDEDSNASRKKIYYTLRPQLDQPPVYSPSPRNERSHHHSSSCSRYRDWNPPLLGTLPVDFLRIKERTRSSHHHHHHLSSNAVNNGNSSSGGGDGDLQLDERKIAVLLKNEEFLKELRRNKAFMNEVTKIMSQQQQQEHQRQIGGGGSKMKLHKPLEDVSFKDNLKHMSKYARSTFYDIASKFTRKRSYKSMNNNVFNNADCDFQ